MTTKEQERKALEQIKKIIDTVSEGNPDNSYIGIAFDGCVEDAEENIENDFAFSMKRRWEISEEANQKQADDIEKLRKQNEELQKELRDAQAGIEWANDRARDFEDRLCAMTEQTSDLNDQLNKAHALIHDRDFEIMTLKARLYDLLYKKEA